MKRVECLLWDFGDTRCDELSLWRVSADWMEVYRSFDDGRGAGWSLGDLDTGAVVVELAKRMPFTEAEILAHLRRTELFEFFPFTYAFFRARHLPQAIVTVNPAFFSAKSSCPAARSMKSPARSWSPRKRGRATTGAMPSRARADEPLVPSRALLIDDKRSNLDAWAALGGIGYLYTRDLTFRQDVAGGIDDLIGRWASTLVDAAGSGASSPFLGGGSVGRRRPGPISQRALT